MKLDPILDEQLNLHISESAHILKPLLRQATEDRERYRCTTYCRDMNFLQLAAQHRILINPSYAPVLIAALADEMVSE